jgi:hypothetical protein
VISFVAIHWKYHAYYTKLVDDKVEKIIFPV